MRRAAGALVASLALAAAPAAAKTHYFNWNVQAAPIEVNVEFHGDAAAGCADHGLCDTSGTAIYTAPKGYGILSGQSNGKRFTSYGLAFSLKKVATLTVSATTAGAAVPCTDQSSGLLTLFGIGNERNFVFGSIPQGSFPGFPTGQPFADFLASRCAGPTGADVASGLVAKQLPRNFLARKTLIIDLNRSAPFAGGGFAGTVTTTGRLTLRR